MVGNEVAKAPMSQRQFGLTLALHGFAERLPSPGRLALRNGPPRLRGHMQNSWLASRFLRPGSFASTERTGVEQFPVFPCSDR